MRRIRQGPTGSKGGDDLTIQLLMENFTALQESVAASRAEQAHREEQFRLELEASRVTNDELRKTNEELRRDFNVWENAPWESRFSLPELGPVQCPSRRQSWRSWSQ